MTVCRLLFLALIATCVLNAQNRILDHNLHGWYAYFGDHPVRNSKWGVHLEGQWRRHNVITQWQQLLLRPGVNYQATKNIMLTAGCAFARSHVYSEHASPAPPSIEHRLWEQVWIRYPWGPVSWSTRFRFENRFIGSADAQTGATRYRFENRFRTWQQIKVPVSRSVYLTAYDEIWFFVKPYQSNSAFDQNRAYGAVGFDLKPSLRLEAGYMNQALLIRTGTRLESNHTIVFSLFSNAPLFGKR